MTREQWLSLLRHALTFIGAFLVAKNYADPNWWGTFGGAILGTVATVWAVFFDPLETSKTDKLVALVRHLFTILAALNYTIKPEMVDQIISISSAIGIMVWGAKAKAQQAKVIELSTTVAVLEKQVQLQKAV